MAKAVVEQIADLVFAQLATLRPGVVTAFGRRALEENAPAYRVVAVPIGAPQILETNMPGDAGFTNVGRKLYHRRFTHEWHCHAIRIDGDPNDFSQTELLYLDTLRSVRFVTHASCEFSDEQWEDQQEGKDSHERFGSVITFRSASDVPIYDVRSGTKALTGTPPFVTTGELNEQEEEI